MTAALHHAFSTGANEFQQLLNPLFTFVKEASITVISLKRALADRFDDGLPVYTDFLFYASLKSRIPEEL
jgi:hypothetical protein